MTECFACSGIDAGIDLFFIVDVMLNFRTAFYLSTGFLETNLREIRKHCEHTQTRVATPTPRHLAGVLLAPGFEPASF